MTQRNETRGENENENENDNENMNATNAEWWEMCWSIRLNDWTIKRCQRRRVGSRNDNILPGYHTIETERVGERAYQLLFGYQRRLGTEREDIQA